jgi:hypothetical protein
MDQKPGTFILSQVDKISALFDIRVRIKTINIKDWQKFVDKIVRVEPPYCRGARANVSDFVCNEPLLVTGGFPATYKATVKDL